MKFLPLLVCLLLPALFLEAKEYTVELDAVPGEDQIFFLDLGGGRRRQRHVPPDHT